MSCRRDPESLIRSPDHKSTNISLGKPMASKQENGSCKSECLLTKVGRRNITDPPSKWALPMEGYHIRSKCLTIQSSDSSFKCHNHLPEIRSTKTFVPFQGSRDASHIAIMSIIVHYRPPRRKNHSDLQVNSGPSVLSARVFLEPSGYC
jgi:hypothetical protein